MDDTVELLDAISRLLGAAFLPIVILAVFLSLRSEINALIRRTNSIAVKGAGIDVSITTQQAQVAGAVAAAVAAKPAEGGDASVAVDNAQAAAKIAAEAVTPEVVQRAQSSTILWVDDRPENNAYERRALEAVGANVVLAKSTEEGLQLARRQRFDAVISDMSRGLDRTAGFKFLDQLRAAGIASPYVIYAGAMDDERRDEARRRGAVGATNRPDELFQTVVSILEKG